MLAFCPLTAQTFVMTDNQGLNSRYISTPTATSLQFNVRVFNEKYSYSRKCLEKVPGFTNPCCSVFSAAVS